MRVFATGGTGYIGSAVTRALARSGHEIGGLVRSDRSAERIQKLGGEPVGGDLGDPASFAEAARGYDAWIHMAIDYEADTAETDRAAMEALLDAAKASGGGTVVYTSGCWVLGDTGEGPVDETAPTDDPPAVVAWRPQLERAVLDAAEDELATAVVRPGMVYGGEGGLVSAFFASAVEEGAAELVGDGSNRWSLVHRTDLAELYVRIVETTGRGVFHGVDGSPVRVVEAARAASEAAGAGGATVAIPLETAREQMGPMADALCLDQALKARRSAELGWQPIHPSFTESVVAAYREWSE